jgi:hypothetical protein
VLAFRKSLKSPWYTDCRKRGLVNAERRMSISSYLILYRRVAARSGRAAPKEPLWSRWYVPWVAAALALTGLIVAAIAALEFVTATPRAPLTPSRHPESVPVEELVSEQALVNAPR